MIICPHCEEPILPGEDVINASANADGARADERRPMHVECLMRIVMGSAGHQMRECTCYGGTRDDPPGVSVRDAARLALATYQALQGSISLEAYK